VLLADAPGLFSLASAEAVMGMVGGLGFFFGTVLFLPDELDATRAAPWTLATPLALAVEAPLAMLSYGMYLTLKNQLIPCSKLM